jgi:hypothetical protein
VLAGFLPPQSGGVKRRHSRDLKGQWLCSIWLSVTKPPSIPYRPGIVAMIGLPLPGFLVLVTEFA